MCQRQENSRWIIQMKMIKPTLYFEWGESWSSMLFFFYISARWFPVSLVSIVHATVYEWKHSQSSLLSTVRKKFWHEAKRNTAFFLSSCKCFIYEIACVHNDSVCCVRVWLLDCNSCQQKQRAQNRGRMAHSHARSALQLLSLRTCHDLMRLTHSSRRPHTSSAPCTPATRSFHWN